MELSSVFIHDYLSKIRAKMKLSNCEKVDMLLVYGECRRNATRAIAMYAEIYPERNQPCQLIFERLGTSHRKSGSFKVTKRNVPKTATSVENTIAVLAPVTENPHISTRQVFTRFWYYQNKCVSNSS
ncbi:hypothetical protein WN55_02427 [Dufourea novaeangliae]|uniref:DUF4817 domain-containing protein n=1 Tax=Dufourea novaeangliae TaxID=178035 RepID=A0A154PHA6_DUFNO|nr:hypothetical protein WN55_02427 [Dufourea novaeangliae]